MIHQRSAGSSVCAYLTTIRGLKLKHLSISEPASHSFPPPTPSRCAPSSSPRSSSPPSRRRQLSSRRRSAAEHSMLHRPRRQRTAQETRRTTLLNESCLATSGAKEFRSVLPFVLPSRSNLTSSLPQASTRSSDRTSSFPELVEQQPKTGTATIENCSVAINRRFLEEDWDTTSATSPPLALCSTTSRTTLNTSRTPSSISALYPRKMAERRRCLSKLGRKVRSSCRGADDDADGAAGNLCISWALTFWPSVRSKIDRFIAFAPDFGGVECTSISRTSGAPC